MVEGIEVDGWLGLQPPKNAGIWFCRDGAGKQPQQGEDGEQPRVPASAPREQHVRK